MEQRILSALRSHKKHGLTRRELAKKIGVRKKQKDQFDAALVTLLEQDKLFRRGEKFIPADVRELTEGEIIKISGTFGFARPSGWDRDVFIPGKYLAGAIPGDKVMLRISPHGRGKDLDEGEVVRVSQPSERPFSGVLEAENGIYTVLPDSAIRLPFPVVKDSVGDARPGDKVLAVIAYRGERSSDHTAKIIESFGSAQNPAACSLAVLAGIDIPIEFPEEVLEQARAIAAFEGIHPKEIAARLDLRDEVIFTIDGADSKDLDDAISLKQKGTGWELGVHIADVSHYVTHKSPLDEEAFRRGTSVYYADRVVPMLPAQLSNGICSLNPGEDRLTFSALIGLDDHGNMTGYRFVKSVIRSRVKGVYAELNSMLNSGEDASLQEKYAEVWPTLTEMRALAEMLIKKRLAAGKMSLESVESKITVDSAGNVAEVKPREHGFFEGLIEEFMLLANEAAASFAIEKGMPFVFRVHEDPAPEKLEHLYQTLEMLGLNFAKPSQSGLSDGLSKILDQAEGSQCAGIVNTLVLRSMAKAKYSAQNTGHFGLALKNYAHFTSPIRRYPDLTIHRVMSSMLSGMKPENLHKRFDGFAPKAAEMSTRREIAATVAERDCESCYKASYMRQFLGDELDGTISGCTAHGLYVQLESTCEGMVRLADFPPGDWDFDGAISYTDRPSGKSIRLGDPVRIKVLAADVSMGRVDFALI